MAEEAPVVEQQTQASPFSGNSWTETIPAVTPAPSPEQPATPKPTNNDSQNNSQAAAPADDAPKEWLKKTFNIDDHSVLLQEREELARLRQFAQTPAEIKFANEQSKLLHEALLAGKEDDVYNFLHQKKTIDKLTGSEINNVSAADIIKYSIQQRNSSLTKDEVDFIFNKKYSIPPQPVKDIADSDEDFKAKMDDWQKQVKLVEQELVIDAKMAVPEIQKLKTELVLPKIEVQQLQVDETQQKELARIKDLRDLYLKHLETDYAKFNGYEIKYKDEEVEIPVSFGVTNEEKLALQAELKEFNLDKFMFERWWDDKGNPNIPQMMDDITLLRNKEKIIQKVVNEVGSKMKEHYIKMKSNININTNGSQSFQPSPDKGSGKSPFAKDAWSETPPQLVHN